MKNYESGPVGVIPSGICVDTGITKREYFAALAMQGMLANSRDSVLMAHTKQIAKMAVAQADALIEELNDETKE